MITVRLWLTVVRLVNEMLAKKKKVFCKPLYLISFKEGGHVQINGHCAPLKIRPDMMNRKTLISAEKLSTQWEPAFIVGMIWLVLAVSLGAYGLMWLLIERLSATRVASLFYLGPPVTMLMAWVAFGDKVRVMDMVGITVVFAGVVVTQMKTEKTN